MRAGKAAVSRDAQKDCVTDRPKKYLVSRGVRVVCR